MGSGSTCIGTNIARQKGLDKLYGETSMEFVEFWHDHLRRPFAQEYGESAAIGVFASFTDAWAEEIERRQEDATP